MNWYAKVRLAQLEAVEPHLPRGLVAMNRFSQRAMRRWPFGVTLFELGLKTLVQRQRQQDRRDAVKWRSLQRQLRSIDLEKLVAATRRAPRGGVTP